MSIAHGLHDAILRVTKRKSYYPERHRGATVAHSVLGIILSAFPWVISVFPNSPTRHPVSHMTQTKSQPHTYIQLNFRVGVTHAHAHAHSCKHEAFPLWNPSADRRSHEVETWVVLESVVSDGLLLGKTCEGVFFKRDTGETDRRRNVSLKQTQVKRCLLKQTHQRTNDREFFGNNTHTLVRLTYVIELHLLWLHREKHTKTFYWGSGCSSHFCGLGLMDK